MTSLASASTPRRSIVRALPMPEMPGAASAMAVPGKAAAMPATAVNVMPGAEAAAGTGSAAGR